MAYKHYMPYQNPVAELNLEWKIARKLSYCCSDVYIGIDVVVIKVI